MSYNGDFANELDKITRNVIVICTGICMFVLLMYFFFTGDGVY